MPDGITSIEGPVRTELSRADIALGLAAFVAWCVLFNIGNTVGAAPLFTALNSQTAGPVHWLLCFVAINFVYTPTNVLMLSWRASWGRSSGGWAAGAGHGRAGAEAGSALVEGAARLVHGLPRGPLRGAGDRGSTRSRLPEITNTADVEKAQVAYRVTATFCSFFCMVEGSRPFVLDAVAGHCRGTSPRPGSRHKSG